MKSRRGGWIAIALIALMMTGCGLLMQRLPNAILPIENVNLTMGNPSNAKTDPNNYLLEKPQYVISYNNSRHILNWSSWQLNRNWLGDVPRSNNFRPDESLPQGFYPVRSSDYNGSGFDRGHMTPSGDRSRNSEDNSATFLMTNILPQAPDNNQGPWKVLEDYCRELVTQGKELYIIAGGYGNQRSIGKSDIKITAPDRVWKVIVVLDKPGLGVAGVNANTRLIAVDMPNQQGIREDDWRKFRVSVDLIEDRTGYNFLTNVSDAIQVQIEEKVDRG
ncbi:DNA/RNA non-specific endonuclease [Phormidesmis priestleyi ANT.L61.2]